MCVRKKSVAGGTLCTCIDTVGFDSEYVSAKSQASVIVKFQVATTNTSTTILSVSEMQQALDALVTNTSGTGSNQVRTGVQYTTWMIDILPLELNS